MNHTKRAGLLVDCKMEVGSVDLCDLQASTHEVAIEVYHPWRAIGSTQSLFISVALTTFAAEGYPLFFHFRLVSWLETLASVGYSRCYQNNQSHLARSRTTDQTLASTNLPLFLLSNCILYARPSSCTDVDHGEGLSFTEWEGISAARFRHIRLDCRERVSRTCKW